VVARIRLLVVLLGLGLVASGCQQADRPAGGSPVRETARPVAGPNRTKAIDMVDVAFQPSRVSLKAHETVRFLFHNWGNDIHEAFIGDERAQRRHERLRALRRRTLPGGSNAVQVSPGGVGELTYTFSQPGPLLIGCHERGHYAAGMKITVTVVP
jgi:uncharacterized cupredoxin-like copper-binding protein